MQDTVFYPAQVADVEMKVIAGKFASDEFGFEF